MSCAPYRIMLLCPLSTDLGFLSTPITLQDWLWVKCILTELMMWVKIGTIIFKNALLTLFIIKNKDAVILWALNLMIMPKIAFSTKRHIFFSVLLAFLNERISHLTDWLSRYHLLKVQCSVSPQIYTNPTWIRAIRNLLQGKCTLTEFFFFYIHFFFIQFPWNGRKILFSIVWSL